MSACIMRWDSSCRAARCEAALRDARATLLRLSALGAHANVAVERKSYYQARSPTERVNFDDPMNPVEKPESRNSSHALACRRMAVVS